MVPSMTEGLREQDARRPVLSASGNLCGALSYELLHQRVHATAEPAGERDDLVISPVVGEHVALHVLAYHGQGDDRVRFDVHAPLCASFLHRNNQEPTPCK